MTEWYDKEGQEGTTNGRFKLQRCKLEGNGRKWKLRIVEWRYIAINHVEHIGSMGGGIHKAQRRGRTVNVRPKVSEKWSCLERNRIARMGNAKKRGGL